MKEITSQMTKYYKLNKLGYDFMGYTFTNSKQLSFHHTIIAKRDCKELQIPENGYIWVNGVILRQDTSHDYLHVIEHIDPEIFDLITSELIDENIKGRIDKENLIAIRDLLLNFEKDHTHERTRRNKQLIKREYIKGRIEL